MRAVQIFAWVLLLVAIVSADPEEEGEVTIYISEEAEIIYHAFGHAAEQCSEENGFCVEDGNPCNGTFKIIHNSCNDLCPCCITDDQCSTNLSAGTPTKVAPGSTDLSTGTPTKVAPGSTDLSAGPPTEVVTEVCEDNWPGICIDGIRTLDDGTTRDVGGCSCGGIKKSGWCDSPEYGQRLCRKTCGYCGVKGCPDGFIMTDGSEQCFKFFNDEERSWREAKSKCEEEGLRLAEPVDAIAVALRKDLLDTYGDGGAWLGARGDGYYYVWESSGTRLSRDSSLLRPGITGNNILRTHCLGLVVTTGAWNKYAENPYGSRACSRDYYTLCEMIQLSNKRVGGRYRWSV